MIDIIDGKIKMKEGIIIGPTYTFDEFKSSKFYNGQDGIRIINIGEKQTINDKKFIVCFLEITRYIWCH